MPQTDPELLKHAKSMRTGMPAPERELWFALRAKRFAGTKFSRQVVVGPFIVDFLARSRKLVVEVDGDTHVDAEKDARRTAWLEQHGYRVIRFTNAEVFQNLEGVLLAIEAALPSPAPLPTLSPEGRGL